MPLGCKYQAENLHFSRLFRTFAVGNKETKYKYEQSTLYDARCERC